MGTQTFVLPVDPQFLSCPAGFQAPPPGQLAYGDANGHGTCVTSVACGYENGVAKGVKRMSMYKFTFDGCNGTSYGMFVLFNSILSAVHADNLQRKAVINYSLSASNLSPTKASNRRYSR